MVVDELRPEAEPLADDADDADVGDVLVPDIRQHADAGPEMPARSGSAGETAGVMRLFPPELVADEEQRPLAEAAPQARDLGETEVLSGVAGIEAEDKVADDADVRDVPMYSSAPSPIRVVRVLSSLSARSRRL